MQTRLQKCFIFFLFYFVVASETTNFAQFGIDEVYSIALNAQNRLYKELFLKRDYHKDLAPINDLLTEKSTIKQRLPMTVKLQSLYVINLDAARQVLAMYLELELVWLDIRLAWNPEDFEGLKTLWIQCDSIWVPNDFAINIISIEEINPERFKQCRFYSNGTMVLTEAYNGEIQCSINVAKFPFDTQKCAIQFSAPAYESYQIDGKGELFTKYSKDTKVAIGNGEIYVTNVTLHQISENDTDPNGGTSGLIGIGFWVTLKREPSFYIYVITIPCFLLTFLSIIGCFWTANLKEEQLAKLSIALTSMMSMTTYVNMVSQQMPKTNHFPLLGTFVLTCVFIISSACVIVVSLPEKKIKREKSEMSAKYNQMEMMFNDLKTTLVAQMKADMSSKKAAAMFGLTDSAARKI